MANLVTGAATIKIQPQTKETPTSNWIKTTVGIEYHIQDQSFYVELPKNEISLRIEGFTRLIQTSREYINSLPIKSNILKENPKPFRFYPMEPRFDLELSSGSFLDENRSEGGIWVTFHMQLSTLNIEKVKLDSIGCTVWTKISEYLFFLDELEREVNTL